jgi:hypothetical protein
VSAASSASMYPLGDVRLSVDVFANRGEGHTPFIDDEINAVLALDRIDGRVHPSHGFGQILIASRTCDYLNTRTSDRTTSIRCVAC